MKLRLLLLFAFICSSAAFASTTLDKYIEEYKQALANKTTESFFWPQDEKIKEELAHHIFKLRYKFHQNNQTLETLANNITMNKECYFVLVTQNINSFENLIKAYPDKNWIYLALEIVNKYYDREYRENLHISYEQCCQILKLLVKHTNIDLFAQNTKTITQSFYFHKVLNFVDKPCAQHIAQIMIKKLTPDTIKTVAHKALIAFLQKLSWMGLRAEFDDLKQKMIVAELPTEITVKIRSKDGNKTTKTISADDFYNQNCPKLRYTPSTIAVVSGLVFVHNLYQYVTKGKRAKPGTTLSPEELEKANSKIRRFGRFWKKLYRKPVNLMSLILCTGSTGMLITGGLYAR